MHNGYHRWETVHEEEKDDEGDEGHGNVAQLCDEAIDSLCNEISYVL